MTYVSGSVDTVHGTITSHWEYDRENGVFTLKLTVPVGVTANVYVPALFDGATVMLDGEPVAAIATEDGGYLLVSESVGSGTYTLSIEEK